jgi:tetratricopeptide (TPR) repeat protein
MAPEQLMAPESVDHRADIYAFGVTLYHIAAGRLPFRGSTEPALIREIISAPVDPIDHPLWEICAACLAKRSADRYQSYGDFLIAVKRLAGRFGVPCPDAPQTADDQAELLYAQAMSYAALGQTQLALSRVQQFIKQFPSDDRGWTELGRILLMEGDASGAVEACRNSIRIAPFKSVARNNLGIALNRLGRNEEAIAQLKLAASHDPLNSGALLNQAGPLFDLGQFDRAIEVLRRAAEIAPRKSTIWVNLGSAYLQIGALDDAESCLQRALQLAPESEEARSLMADLKSQRLRPREIDTAQRIAQLIRRGELDAAEHELAKQCQLRPDHANTWRNRGLVALGRKQPEMAVQCFETAVALSPQDAESRQRLVKLKVAAGRLDEALHDVRPLQTDPKHKVTGECLAAQIMCALGRGEEARASLTELITMNADCDLAWFVLSEVLESIGNLEGALAAARGCVKALLRTGGLADNIQMARARVDELEKRLSRS